MRCQRLKPRYNPYFLSCNFDQQLCKLDLMFDFFSWKAQHLLQPDFMIWAMICYGCPSGSLWLLAPNKSSEEEVFCFFHEHEERVACENPFRATFFTMFRAAPMTKPHPNSLKCSHLPSLRKSLNFNSLANANANSLPVTWLQIKTSLLMPDEE